MGKVWVKGYTKPDGTKVKGHYREMSGRMLDPKRQRQLVAKMRFGADGEKALKKGIEAAKRSGKQSVKSRKKQYGSALTGNSYVPAWARVIGSKI